MQKFFSCKQNEIHYFVELEIIPKRVAIYAQINLVISNDTKNLGELVCHGFVWREWKRVIYLYSVAKP